MTVNPVFEYVENVRALPALVYQSCGFHLVLLMWFPCVKIVIGQYSDAKSLCMGTFSKCIFYLFLPYIYQNINVILSGFLSTASFIHPTSGQFDWLK